MTFVIRYTVNSMFYRTPRDYIIIIVRTAQIVKYIQSLPTLLSVKYIGIGTL